MICSNFFEAKYEIPLFPLILLLISELRPIFKATFLVIADHPSHRCDAGLNANVSKETQRLEYECNKICKCKLAKGRFANKQRLYGSKTINTSLESIASVDSLWMKQKYGHGTKLSLFRKWTIDVCGPVLERNYNTRTDRPNSHLHLYNALSRYAQTNGLFGQRN